MPGKTVQIVKWLLIALSGLALRLWGGRFPWGTLVVNVLGCLAIGFVMHVGLATAALPRNLRFAVTIGFLGALTTFSTFGYETMRYCEAGAWWPAAANIVANVVLTLGAVWLGMVVARTLIGGS